MSTIVVRPEASARKPALLAQLNPLVSRLKNLLFQHYKEEHWPKDIDELACPNGADGGCDTGRNNPCPSCAAYDRLVKEFQAIPVG